MREENLDLYSLLELAAGAGELKYGRWYRNTLARPIIDICNELVSNKLRYASLVDHIPQPSRILFNIRDYRDVTELLRVSYPLLINTVEHIDSSRTPITLEYFIKGFKCGEEVNSFDDLYKLAKRQYLQEKGLDEKGFTKACKEMDTRKREETTELGLS